MKNKKDSSLKIWEGKIVYFAKIKLIFLGSFSFSITFRFSQKQKNFELKICLSSEIEELKVYAFFPLIRLFSPIDNIIKKDNFEIAAWEN